jgi:hypothetical protein
MVSELNTRPEDIASVMKSTITAIIMRLSSVTSCAVTFGIWRLPSLGTSIV